MNTNLQVILVRPGATDLDVQGRITGTLDIPLNDEGVSQAQQTALEIDEIDVDAIYAAPCMSAQQTAKIISKKTKIKVRTDDNLLNLDHGLWHGKLVEELKSTHPKFFKQWRDHPESVSPPGGETTDKCKLRVEKVLKKIRKKHKQGTVVIIVPEPLRSIMQNEINASPDASIFKNSCSCGKWETVDVPANANS